VSKREHRLIPLFLQVMLRCNGENSATFPFGKAGILVPAWGPKVTSEGGGVERRREGPRALLTRRGKINLRARRSRARDLLVRRYSAGRLAVNTGKRDYFLRARSRLDVPGHQSSLSTPLARLAPGYHYFSTPVSEMWAPRRRGDGRAGDHPSKESRTRRFLPSADQ